MGVEQDQPLHYTEYIRVLRTTYNADAPIHRRLPPEVLMEVFARIRPQTRRNIRYLHVCRAWRELILRTPEFWLDMLQSIRDPDFGTSGPAFRAFLELSSPQLLHAATDLSAMAYDLLAPHASRISSLALCVRSLHAVVLYKMLTCRMPHLNTLIVEHSSIYSPLKHDQWALIQRMRSLPDCLPSLRTLRIPTVFPSPTIGFEPLQSLELGGCDCSQCIDSERSHMTLSLVLSVLQRCPLPVSLRLLGNTRAPISSALASISSVDLPLFRTLTFGWEETEWISDVLRSLNVPSLTELNVRTRTGDRCISIGLRALPMIFAISLLKVRIREESGVYVCRVQNHIAGIQSLYLKTENIFRHSDRQLFTDLSDP